MSSRSHDWVINASELAQYSFCAHSWWLDRVKGIPSAHSAEMSAGHDLHLIHGRVVHRYMMQRLLAQILGVAALLTAAVGVYLSWWGS
jgi:hypothetical protein